jgi:hypothetical protein
LAVLVGGFLLMRGNKAKKEAAQRQAASRSAPPKFEPARAPEPPPAPEPEAEEAAAAEPAHEDTTTLTQDAALDATTTMEHPSITIDQAPASGDKEIDFDITSQIEAQTVPISLEANDPISEADFHLAYGLYDEAILLLKEAIQKDPARKELVIKLAETYFAAGRSWPSWAARSARIRRCSRKTHRLPVKVPRLWTSHSPMSLLPPRRRLRRR